MFVGFVGFVVLRIFSSNFRPARNALACEAGGHFSPGPDLVIAYSAKINQNCCYIRSKRIFK